MNAQSNVAPQQKKDTRKGKPNESHISQGQSLIPIASKDLVKIVGTPLNIVD